MRSRLALLVFSIVFVVSVGCKKDPKDPTNIDQVPVEKTLNLPGLTASVDVVRDEFFRPHIYAENEADLFMAYGYVQASDRFVEMDFHRRFPTGRLAELAGGVSPSLADTDYDNRVLGITAVAQSIYDSLANDDPLRLNVEAYSAGVNAWIDNVKSGNEPLPLEYGLVSYPASALPAWTPVDTFAVGRLLAMDLSWDEDQKVGLRNAIRALNTAFPSPDLRNNLICDGVLNYRTVTGGSIVDPEKSRPDPVACTPPVVTANVTQKQADTVESFVKGILHHPLNKIWAPDRGSNNWIVGPTASASGFPILANDPHLGLSTPSIWHQVHLNTTRAGGTLDVIGVALPGVPLVLIGHNGRVAWGVTNVGPDVSDNYVETYLPDGGGAGIDQVMFDDGSGGGAVPVNLTARTETIQVRSGANVVDDVRQVLDVPHRAGSIIPGTYDATSGTAISWRWVGFDVTQDVILFDGLSRAGSEAEILTAIDAAQGIPSAPQNVVYITEAGEFGYKANGRYPIRDDDDGNPYTDPPYLPHPGVGTHEWIDFVDPADVPQSSNPSRGFLQSANQDPLGGTDDGDPLNDAVYIGFNFDFGQRGARIHERLAAEAADGGVTVQDMMDIQADIKSPLGTRMTTFILQAIAGNSSYQVAGDLLQGWHDRGYIAASGVGPNPLGPNEAEDAAATILFNAWLVEFQDSMLNDELGAAGIGISSQQRARIIIQALEDPAKTATYDAATTDSVLFDNVATTGVTETRNDIIVSALDDALAWLASPAGFGSSDPADWKWGDKHRLTLDHLLGIGSLSVPTQNDPDYPGGFPHGGDNYVVDASNPGLTNHNYNYGGGPSVRIVTEAEPGKFRMHMSFPGGALGDSTSVHYDDQIRDHYIFNQYRQFWFYENEVAKNGRTRTVFEP